MTEMFWLTSSIVVPMPVGYTPGPSVLAVGMLRAALCKACRARVDVPGLSNAKERVGVELSRPRVLDVHGLADDTAVHRRREVRQG